MKKKLGSGSGENVGNLASSPRDDDNEKAEERPDTLLQRADEEKDQMISTSAKRSN